MTRFFRTLLRRFRRPAARPLPRQPFKPGLEALENRLAPAASTLTVGAGQAYSSVQAAVNAAHPGDTVLLNSGTYVEQVVLGAGKDNITLQATTALGAILQAPAAMTGHKAVVEINGAHNVTLNGLTIQGPGGNTSHSLEAGVWVLGGGSASILNNHITQIHDTPFNPLATTPACQSGIAIRVGDALVGQPQAGQVGTADIENNVLDNYQKGGVVVSGPGSAADVQNNTIGGAGPAASIAQYGVLVNAGATADVDGNTISGNAYSGPGFGGFFAYGAGVLLANAGSVSMDHNTLSTNDYGVAVVGGTSALIDYNQIFNNLHDGIALIGAAGACVHDNNVHNNADNGIHLSGNATCNTVRNNQVRNNGKDGLSIEAGSVKNKIKDNDLHNNGKFDAEDLTTGSGTAGTGNTWCDNEVGKDNKHGGLDD